MALTGLLAEAELVLQAKNYSGTGAWLDESGNGHDGQLGSTSGADTNDPLFLEPDGGVGGTQYLWLPGVDTDYARVADYAALDVAGDYDIRVKMRMGDWSPADTMGVLDRLGTAGDPNRSIRLSVVGSSSGMLLIGWCPTGSFASYTTAQATAATGITDGATYWVRATLDMDNGAGGYDVKFYKSVDGDSWTQIGATVTGGAPTSQAAVLSPLDIGRQGGTGPITADIYRVQIYDGIDGTLVLDADFTDRTLLTEPFATFTEKANDAVVTINRAATDKPATVVDRPMFVFDGIDDYIEIADHDDLDFGASDSFTVLFTALMNDVTPAAQATVVGKRPSAGYQIYVPTTGGRVSSYLAGTPGGGYALGAASAITDNTLFAAALVFNRTTGFATMFLDGTSVGATPLDISAFGSLSNTGKLYIGTLAAAGDWFLGQIHAVALWRRALTDTEILSAGRELVAGLPSQVNWFRPSGSDRRTMLSSR